MRARQVTVAPLTIQIENTAGQGEQTAQTIEEIDDRLAPGPTLPRREKGRVGGVQNWFWDTQTFRGFVPWREKEEILSRGTGKGQQAAMFLGNSLLDIGSPSVAYPSPRRSISPTTTRDKTCPIGNLGRSADDESEDL